MCGVYDVYAGAAWHRWSRVCIGQIMFHKTCDKGALFAYIFWGIVTITPCICSIFCIYFYAQQWSSRFPIVHAQISASGGRGGGGGGRGDGDFGGRDSG